MWARQIAMAVIGLSAGSLVASGLIAFIIGLGVISDFADRTNTANNVLLYEDAVALGGILGNIVYLYQIPIPGASVLLGIFGLLSGIFVGCWAMALAEVLNVFPIFMRRAKLSKGIPYFILSIAVGKAVGGIIYFFFQW